MNELIEQDALITTPDDPPPQTPHTDEVFSFVAAPRMEQSAWQKLKSWLAGDQPTDAPVVWKSANGLRYILSITSNSYVDREDERITSDALKAYEASCFPGEGVYHNDNIYVWWHDEDVVMGNIVAVNYSEPFLVEIIQEIPNDPVSKVLFDYAEKNGHKAGASHKFGYRADDRTEDGDYLHIYKKESTFLPDRSLAANALTYAGVMTDMASKQSNEWLDKIFEEATAGAVTNVSAMLHDKSSDQAKKLAELKGLVFKAFPPKPAAKPAVAAAAVDEAVEGAIEDDVVEEAVEESAPMDAMQFMTFLTEMFGVFQDMLDAQMGMTSNQMGLMKELTELKELRVAEKSADTATMDDLARQLGEMKAQMAQMQKQLNLAPKSVSVTPGSTAEAVIAAVNGAEKARVEGETVNDPFWGPIKPLPK